MPYIAKKDRRFLNPLIKNIERAIKKTAKSKTDKDVVIWQLLRYTATRLVFTVALDAVARHQGKRTLRYWIIALVDGIFMNVARELKRRLALPSPDGRLMFELFAFEKKLKPAMKTVVPKKLDKDIDILARKITRIANIYNYDGAFAGLCNYCLSALGPQLIAENHGSSEKALQKLVHFWHNTADEFYRLVAIPYEDLQIAKPESGDCDIFISLLKKQLHSRSNY